MLILTRRVGEIIRIGEDVEVEVLGVKGNTVRIGIRAPKTVVVDRAEVYERKRREGLLPPPGLGTEPATAPRNHPLDPLPST